MLLIDGMRAVPLNPLGRPPGGGFGIVTDGRRCVVLVMKSSAGLKKPFVLTAASFFEVKYSPTEALARRLRKEYTRRLSFLG
jgi:hypothetical protein